MNRAQSGANWSGVPSLSHPWMAALLRLTAMLVSRAVRSSRMLLTCLPRECHTDVERDRLPAREDGNQQKEETAAAAGSQLHAALMVSSSRSERPSNHEG